MHQFSTSEVLIYNCYWEGGDKSYLQLIMVQSGRNPALALQKTKSIVETGKLSVLPNFKEKLKRLANVKAHNWKHQDNDDIETWWISDLLNFFFHSFPWRCKNPDSVHHGDRPLLSDVDDHGYQSNQNN